MRICVVGGGLAGLTAARALVAAGVDARVREAAPRAGGVIGTSVKDGFRREHAASSFLGGPGDGGLALCRELGVPVEKASEAARRRWIYIDGKLRALPSSPLAFVRSDLLTWRGKLDLLREPFRDSRPKGTDESVHAFAARRFGPEVARAIVAPFVTGIYAADAHDVSLVGGFPKLAELDAAGGVVRGMLGKLLRGKRGGAPEPKTERGMHAPVAGLGALIDALAANLGDRVELGSPVERIAREGADVTVDGERFDGVVLAIPAELAIDVVAAMPELGSRLGAFRRAPVALVYLGFDELPAASDAFGFLVAQGEAPRVLGCVFESTVWRDRAPAGQTLLRCIYGGARDPSACALSDAELVQQATRDLATALGVHAPPRHASVMRWARGLPRYPVGHRERVNEAVVAARSQRIALAGADYRGPGVNDLCADAATVVREVTSW